MPKVVLTDTGFWIGLVDPKDQYHSSSLEILDLLMNYQILFPWPCLYETISTRLTRRRDRLLYLDEIISKSNINLLDDHDYKAEALNQVFEYNKKFGLTYSLVDSVVREILKDEDVSVNYLITYNAKDFQDVCIQRGIEIFSG